MIRRLTTRRATITIAVTAVAGMAAILMWPVVSGPPVASAEEALPAAAQQESELEVPALPVRPDDPAEVEPIHRKRPPDEKVATTQFQPNIAPCKGRFDAAIEAAQRHVSINDQLLRAVMVVESACDPAAVSSKGAVGLMQVVPHSGGRDALWALRPDMRGKQPTRDALMTPIHNILLGAAYLHAQWERYSAFSANPRRRLALTLSAYNAGPTRVRNALKKDPIGPHWSRWAQNNLPRETSTYVQRVFEQLKVPPEGGKRLAALVGD